MNLGVEPPSSCNWKNYANSEMRLGRRRAVRRRTRRSDRESLGLDEVIPDGIIMNPSSHDTNPSTPIEERSCRKPLVQS